MWHWFFITGMSVSLQRPFLSAKRFTHLHVVTVFCKAVLFIFHCLCCLPRSGSSSNQNSCIYSGVTARRFTSHTKDVLTVAFSTDNRQIVSGSRDKTIKLWNTVAHCKYTIEGVGVEITKCICRKTASLKTVRLDG